METKQFNGRLKLADEIEKKISPILKELRDSTLKVDEVFDKHRHFIYNILKEEFVNETFYDDFWFETKLSIQDKNKQIKN